MVIYLKIYTCIHQENSSMNFLKSHLEKYKQQQQDSDHNMVDIFT